MRDDPHLLGGLNVYKGGIVHPAVADALGLQGAEPQELMTA